jgi:hypothetical protein
METEYNYTCPNCSQECTVPESLAGQNVTCPSCKVDFFATPPETPTPLEALSQAPTFKPPAKLPFFKSGKIAMLEERLQELFSIHGGVVADDTRQELQRDAIVLGLPENAANELLREHFMHELAPIKERMQSLSTMTDQDYDDIEQLEKKYNQESYDFQELRKQYNGDLVLALREKDSLAMLKTDALTFLLVNKIESTGYLPPPIKSDLMLKCILTATLAHQLASLLVSNTLDSALADIHQSRAKKLPRCRAGRFTLRRLGCCLMATQRIQPSL